MGRLRLPGNYTVSLEKREDQATTELAPPCRSRSSRSTLPRSRPATGN